MASIVFIAWLASREKKPRKVLTNHDVKLYREAAKILNRLVNVTDLSGAIPEDIVSPTTRKQIEDWLANYRKELDK